LKGFKVGYFSCFWKDRTS